MRLFGTERIAGIMDRLGVQEGEVIEHPLVTRAIGNAQKRVEAHNFEIRKHLLKYDDVMNKQREVIYGLRNKMLDHGDPREEVEGWIEELVAGRVAHYLPDRNHPDVWNLKGLADEIGFLLRQPVDTEAVGGENADYEEVENAACAYVVQEFAARVERLGGEPFLEVVRNVILWTIDDKWRDHLYELDQLKHGIGMRAYGQTDPLLEYKGEAFKMFEVLVSEVEEESVRRIFRIEPAEPAPPPVSTTTLHMVASKAEVGNVFEAMPQSGGGVAVAEGEEPQAGRGGRLSSPTPQPPAPRRAASAGPRAGRHDPCPCGSG
jgi:preprotein translocase subunit SecA